jgi:hypothetical protein
MLRGAIYNLKGEKSFQSLPKGDTSPGMAAMIWDVNYPQGILHNRATRNKPAIRQAGLDEVAYKTKLQTCSGSITSVSSTH